MFICRHLMRREVLVDPLRYDGAEHPAYTMSSYTPSMVPGCRTPHLWCEDGGSLYDAIGAEFTLLRFDRALDVAALELAARHLSRPDHHVACRGDRVPADPLTLIDRVRALRTELLEA